jgi:hypothetical protein
MRQMGRMTEARVLQGRRQSDAEDLHRNGDGGHRPGPAGVEREVDDDLLELGLAQTDCPWPARGGPELFGTAVR